MPNDVTNFLNTLNSFISCPSCKVTNEIEIILRCGHVICKDCKIKRTKCPSCYTDLSATREHSPSVKFIEELREEWLKVPIDIPLNYSSEWTPLAKSIPDKNNIEDQVEKGKESVSGTKGSDEVDKNSTSIVTVQLADGCFNDSEEQAEEIKVITASEEKLIENNIKKISGYFSETISNYEVVKKTTISGNLLNDRVDSKVNNSNSTERNNEEISRTTESKVVKSQKGVGHIESTEADDVIIIDETRNELSELDRRKNNKHKKKVVFYGKFIKNQDEVEVNKKILNNLGIVGIDKKIKNGESKPGVNASEIEWNGQLNTIISRLNYSSKNVYGKTSNTNDYSPVMTNRDNTVIFQEKREGNPSIKMISDIPGFKLSKSRHDLKRKTDDSSLGSSSHLSTKRRKKNMTVKNIDNLYNEKGLSFKVISNDSQSSFTSDKKLGGIVDEDELVKRYLHGTMKDEAKCNIGDQSNKSDNFEVSCNKQLKKSISKDLSNDLNLSSIVDKTNSNNENVTVFKSDIMSIVSDLLSKQSQNPDGDGLRSDIMADMLSNVSNEIIIVGSKLCSAVKANTDSLSSGSDKRSNRCHKLNKTSHPSILPHSSICQHLPHSKSHLSIRKGKNSRSCGTILISDSDDEIEKVAEINRISNSSQIKADLPITSPEKDINIKNCKVVIENFIPSMFQSLGSNINVSNCKDVSKKTSSLVKKSPDSSVSFGNFLTKKGGKHEDTKKLRLDHSKQNDVLYKCKKEENNFEGFTEQDILILTVKLALFKMNGYKYLNNLSTSSLYSLDGKQILIKDMSQEKKFTVSSWENRSSHLAVEISDSEDESSRAVISSSVQTENDINAVTPSPSTSRIRPVSLAKLRGLERANEKFMKNDILDTREPLTPDTPHEKDAVSSSLSPNSPVQRLAPVSRRQLSFMSPSLDRALQSQGNGTMVSSTKETERGCNSSGNDWQVLHYRMKYMIPNNNEEASHYDFERYGVSPTRLTFTTCGLNSKETALVTKLAQMTKSCLTKDFTHNTTHLIIGAAGRGTLEYYLAIAYRAFIVTIEWVSLCIALNKILPVTGFIPTEDEGPLKCLEPITPPFFGFYVCSKILPSASNYPIAEITKTLLSLGGARLLSEIDAFLTLQDGNYPRFFVYGADSQMTQAVIDKCATMRVVPVQFMWVYESVSAFRALPVMDYLGTVIHSRTLIRDYKVPEQLACSRYPRLEGEFRPQILDERYQRSL